MFVILMIHNESERTAMTKIFEDYGPFVYKCINRFSGVLLSADDRSDIFQDVMERLIKHIETLMKLQEKPLCSYIQATTKSAVCTFLNKNQKHIAESLESLKEEGFERADDTAGPLYEPLETEEYRQRVRKVVESLPERERDVLIYKYFLEKSDAEIASCLGVSSTSVRVYLTRGRKRLLTLWREEEV